MILVTVGQERFPFDRLLRLADDAVASGEVEGPAFAQTGHSAYVPRAFPHANFLPPDKLRDLIRRSTLVITHGGVGTIVQCLDEDKVPLVVPRDPRLGEHLDGHQLEFSARMEIEGRVLVARDDADFRVKLLTYESLVRGLRAGCRRPATAPLVEFLENFSRAIRAKKTGR
ncbi:MAG: beta(1,3)galactosyltransferase EpsH [Candidatus Aminicenantes bacterium]|nr:beta(1,3)galactosyltransferase EpsH [Candidatus Aminicenantes bacterium]